MNVRLCYLPISRVSSCSFGRTQRQKDDGRATLSTLPAPEERCISIARRLAVRIRRRFMDVSALGMLRAARRVRLFCSASAAASGTCGGNRDENQNRRPRPASLGSRGCCCLHRSLPHITAYPSHCTQSSNRRVFHMHLVRVQRCVFIRVLSKATCARWLGFFLRCLPVLLIRTQTTCALGFAVLLWFFLKMARKTRASTALSSQTYHITPISFVSYFDLVLNGRVQHSSSVLPGIPLKPCDEHTPPGLTHNGRERHRSDCCSDTPGYARMLGTRVRLYVHGTHDRIRLEERETRSTTFLLGRPLLVSQQSLAQYYQAS